MTSFGLVTEGITDQKIIEKIIYGFFNNPDIPINTLSPLRDETDENRASTNSNWIEVLNYCCSDRLKKEIYQIDYLIIQIDSDALKGESVPEKFRINFPSSPTMEDTVNLIQGKIIELIDENFYQTVKNKIIFAISVEMIECWLLPIYYKSQKTTANKTNGCIDTLNKMLVEHEGFYINHKKPENYAIIAHHFRKRKTLIDSAKLNSNLNLFLTNLKTVNFTES